MTYGQFYETTRSQNSYVKSHPYHYPFEKTLSLDGTNYNLEIYRLQSMRGIFSEKPLYKCVLIMVVFSIVDKDSFRAVVDFTDHNMFAWKENECHYNPYFTFVLVGNKGDLKDKRIISVEKAEEAAKELGCPYFEVSAKTGENVQGAFEDLLMRGMPVIKRTIPLFKEKLEKKRKLLVDYLEGFFNSPVVSDLKIVSEKEVIYLHSTIIKHQCPSFLDCFKSDTFNCVDVPYDDLLVLTKWIYCGKLEHPQPENLEQYIKNLNLLPFLQKNLQKTLPNEIPPFQTPSKQKASKQSHKQYFQFLKSTTTSFESLLTDLKSTDLTICIGKKKYPVHKQILSLRSSYIRKLLENQEPHPKKLALNLIDQGTGFPLVLRYIYTDSYPGSDDDVNYEELFEMSFLLELDDLTHFLEKKLIKSTQAYNCVPRYEYYLKHSNAIPRLLPRVRYIAGYYYPYVEKSKDFQEADVAIQQELRSMRIEGDWIWDTAHQNEVRGDWLYEKVDDVKKKNCSLQ